MPNQVRTWSEKHTQLKRQPGLPEGTVTPLGSMVPHGCRTQLSTAQASLTLHHQSFIPCTHLLMLIWALYFQTKMTAGIKLLNRYDSKKHKVSHNECALQHACMFSQQDAQQLSSRQQLKFYTSAAWVQALPPSFNSLTTWDSVFSSVKGEQ